MYEIGSSSIDNRAIRGIIRKHQGCFPTIQNQTQNSVLRITSEDMLNQFLPSPETLVLAMILS